ncbi:nuclear transport factor 2 family protein [Streptomyces sp. NPDC048197]|uniref:nuclear transport factor 2 family protein n=1 Tax=Streptomyces sp. NPDC048197 TaxID=3365511 RepID=UPI00371693C9
MGADNNVGTIRSIYAAFEQGDVPAILDTLSEDIDWATETSSTVAPWYGVRHGKDEVASFFEQFGSTMEVEEFTPITFAVSDSDVLTVVRMRAHNRATGKPVAMNLHHQFTFRNGKITYHRSAEDTAQVEAAFKE